MIREQSISEKREGLKSFTRTFINNSNSLQIKAFFIIVLKQQNVTYTSEIRKIIDVMVDKLTTDGNCNFKHLLHDENVNNEATEIVTKALRSSKDTNVALSDLYDFYTVHVASFLNVSGLTVTSSRHIPEIKRIARLPEWD